MAENRSISIGSMLAAGAVTGALSAVIFPPARLAPHGCARVLRTRLSGGKFHYRFWGQVSGPTAKKRNVKHGIERHGAPGHEIRRHLGRLGRPEDRKSTRLNSSH